MPDLEEIERQQKLLAIHRRNLGQYLEQAAQLGSAFTPPGVTNGIHDAREQIARIKQILRDWDVVVEDYPDDGAPNAPTRRPRVFVSYKRGSPDEMVALELYAALREQCDVFIDQDLPIGVNWAERIEVELRRSDFLLTLLSAHSVGSEMVLAEIRTASELARISGRPGILPLRINFREPFHYPLSTYLDPINWAFWQGPGDTPALIESLRRAIRGGALAIATDDDKQRVLQVPVAALPVPAPAAQPLPRAAVELPEGTIDTQSAFYVVRDTDQIVSDTIVRQGVTVTIKGPRQMGKSSLLIRAAEVARTVGKRVAFLDFQLFDHAALLEADRFFPQFCAWLSDELELESRVDEYWSKPLGNVQRCTQYVGRYLLKTLDAPLALAMDEVESMFEADFRSDFFSMLRSWHNSRANMPVWKRLDLVLVTSTEPYQLIDNLNQSPFNVGTVIELDDFTPAQVADLNIRHGSPLPPEDERRLLTLLGGHPFLVRRALYHVASGRTTASTLFASAADDRGPFGDHLRYHLFRMRGRPELIQGMRDVLVKNSCADDAVYWRLRGAGLVRRAGLAVLPRNQLYADYFRHHLDR